MHSLPVFRMPVAGPRHNTAYFATKRRGAQGRGRHPEKESFAGARGFGLYMDVRRVSEELHTISIA